MGKGSSSSTTTSSSSGTSRPDENAYQAYLSLLQRAQGVASTPYEGYAGEQVAPINAQQTAGIGGINTAADYLTAQQGPLSAADIQRYQDPYTQSVIDATQRDFDVQNQRNLSNVTGNAAAVGALGGDRAEVAKALANESATRTQAPIIAGLRSQGYQQALQTAQNQQQQALRAGLAGVQGAQAQIGAGTLQQQTQQAQDTQNRLDYYQKQGYPFQVAQWLAAIDTGVGSQMGGTSTSYGTGTTQGPTPNTWSQVLGGGLALAGLFSDREMKENIEKIGETNDGQPIYRFNYKGQPQTTIGLMHDEVEEAHPEATGRVAGLGMVDYRKATDDSVERFRGGRAGFAMGGVPWSEGPSWIPSASGITGGRGAPAAPSLISPKAPEQQSGLSKDAMKGIGAIGKGMGGLDWSGLWGSGGDLSGDAWGGGSFASGDAWGGSSSNPLPGLSAEDYGVGYGRGGRIRRYANGGYAYGGMPDDDEATFDERFGAAFPNRVTAGIGASRPALEVVNPDEPFRMLDRPSAGAEPPALQEWRGGVDRDIGLGLTAPEPDERPIPEEKRPGLPSIITAGRSRAVPEAEEEPSGVLAYGEGMPLRRGVGAPASTPEGAPDESFLGRLGIRMTPELKQGLLMAGLSMMANRRGGPGSFLSNLGEAGVAGVGAYNQTVQNMLDQAKEARKEAFEREKFERPYSEMTAAQKAQMAKEYKPSYGVIREETDPDTGLTRKVYGWIDPNKQKVTGPEGGTAQTKAKSVYVDEAGQPVTGDAFLKRLSEISPERANRAKMIGDYKANPSGLSLRGGRREQALADAAAYNPDYDQRLYTSSQAAVKNFNAGVESRTVRSLNVAIDHLATLDEAAKAMQNSDYPMLNKIVNTYRQNTGSKLTTDFDSIKQVVSTEIAKAVVGGQTALHDRDDMAKRASNAQSPDQLMGITQEFRKLMASQMKGLRRTYESTTKMKNFDDYLEPETQKALKGLEHVEDNYNKGKMVEGGEKPKKGDRKQFKQGWGVFDGDKWVPE